MGINAEEWRNRFLAGKDGIGILVRRLLHFFK